MRMISWEEELKDRNIEFEYLPEVPLADLVKEEQTRLDLRGTSVLDDERVMGIWIHLDDGHKVPPLLGERLHTGALKLDDGFHRESALKMFGATTHDCYVLKFPNSASRDEFLSSVNLWTNGQRTTREQQVKMALLLAQRNGISLKRAAQIQQVPESTVATAHRSVQAQSRLMGLGIEPDKLKMSPGHIMALGSIHNDEVLKATAAAVRGLDVTLDTFKPLVRAVNEARAEGQALEEVKKWRQRWVETHPVATTAPRKSTKARTERPAARMSSHLSWAGRNAEKIVDGTSATIPEERKVLLIDLEKHMGVMGRLDRFLRAPMRQPQRPAALRGRRRKD